jgi:hypothetical protein
LKRFQDISGPIPAANIAQAQIVKELLPTYMPDILRSRAQFSIQQHVDNTANALRDELTRRGVTGPGAEALVSHVREQGLQSQAQLASDIGGWEAESTLKNQRQAFLDTMGLTGETAQYAQAGARGLPGVAMQGGLDLTRLFGQAAQSAAAPYYAMGRNLGSAAMDYFGMQPKPQTPSDYSSPAPYPTGLPMPGVGGGTPGGFNPPEDTSQYGYM